MVAVVVLAEVEQAVGADDAGGLHGEAVRACSGTAQPVMMWAWAPVSKRISVSTRS